MSIDIEVVVSFDTTGSMYPCITQVRREVTNMTKTLFKDIPNFRMGIIAHGDYCDEGSTYVIKEHELSEDKDSIVKFINNCGNTYGGDAPECYELVLHTARSFKWTAGKQKVLVLIGDDLPHTASEKQNKKHLDWKNEADCLNEMGVKVYSVQALNRRYASSFYETIAEKTGGFKLELDQFNEVVDLIKAICYQQVSSEEVDKFVDEVQGKKTISRAMMRNYAILLGKEVSIKSEAVRKRYAKVDMEVVPSGRFQILEVDSDASIRNFVQEQGLTFKPGRGFYEFTKKENIQGYKEIILQDKVTGDFFYGNKVREILGIPEGYTRISPKETVKNEYRIFVQSTSYNRKLIGGTKFLYEVEDYDRVSA